jgi:hypothetical protein
MQPTPDLIFSADEGGTYVDAKLLASEVEAIIRWRRALERNAADRKEYLSAEAQRVRIAELVAMLPKQ